ncbi:hypothetical protein [Rhodococcus sp. NPDC060176]
MTRTPAPDEGWSPPPDEVTDRVYESAPWMEASTPPLRAWVGWGGQIPPD